MNKALIWKEYRDIRLPLIITVLSCAVLALFIILVNRQHTHHIFIFFSMSRSSTGIREVLIHFTVFVMCIYALLAGAESFASEYQAKTFDFLTSRSVSRDELWRCKFGIRISTLLLPVLYLILADRFLLRDKLDYQYQCIVVSSILMLFSTGLFFSTIFNRPVKAGITGLTVCIGYTAFFFRFTDSIDLFTITSVLPDIMFLTGSYLIFTKGKFTYPV